jgi:hypothetical protein
VLALLFALVSCAKDDTPSGDLNGTYTGTYIQTGSSNDQPHGEDCICWQQFQPW